MANARFEECLKFILKWEGGFTNDPDDPGGATNLGIIQTEYDKYRASKSLPHQSVKNISHAEASEIYVNNYWAPLKCDAMPRPLDLVMFDTGANMSNGVAIRPLQQSIGFTADGSFGP